MSEYVTKKDLTTILDSALTRFSATINDRIDGFESRVNKRFQGVEEQLQSLNDDMSKVKHGLLDYLGTDRAVHNLVRELQAKGIAIEDSKIFAL